MGYAPWVALWALQVLLALLFLFSGGMKLFQPLKVLKERFPLPGPFVRFIGVAEVLGAVGLILPTLLDVWPVLTPVAALGLAIVMIGATVVTWKGEGPRQALLPLASGLLLVFVAWGGLVW